MRKIKVVGLTGQTGAGKSEVSHIIRSQGLMVIDCDQLAHTVANEEKSCLADLALEFSIGILNPEGTLNRKRLGAIVFGDKRRLERLNAIIFPYIRARLNLMMAEMETQGAPVVVLDAPTLFESGMDAECDYIAGVIAPVHLRQNRIVVRDHITDDEARKRISSQQNDAYFKTHCSFIIENIGDKQDLRLKTLEMVEDFCHRFAKGKG